MDRKAVIEKLKNMIPRRKGEGKSASPAKRKKVLVFLTGVVGALALASSLWVLGPHVARHAKVLVSATVGFLTPSNLIAEYGQPLRRVQERVDEIREHDGDYDRLKQGYDMLRARVEALQFDCHVKDATASTRDLELKLDKETASRVGRSLATINYNIPAYLLPNQLHTLGVSYFKAREDEKAAKIFSHLTGFEDSDVFKTPRNYLISGVLWYRLDNYELAEHYFDKVINGTEGPDTVGVQAQARLWKALALEREGKHSKSQHWLRELIDHHPHSTESGWVNTMGAERATASEE